MILNGLNNLFLTTTSETMKSIYQLCNDKGITIKQLFQEINKPFKFLKDAEWRNMLNSNEFSDKVSTRICDILEVGLLEIDILDRPLEKPRLSPVKSESFKKADLSKISNIPKASDKQKPNRELLDAAKGQPCIKCGNDVGATVSAHYEGIRSHLFGKGTSQKPDDFFSCWLCDVCHDAMDGRTPELKDLSKVEKSEEFLFLILMTKYEQYKKGRG